MNDSSPMEMTKQAPDKETLKASLYTATTWEIFWKNFLSGASRALGSLFIYAIVFVLGIGVTIQMVLPKITPLIESFMKMEETVTNVNQFKIPTSISIPENLPSFQLPE